MSLEDVHAAIDRVLGLDDKTKAIISATVRELFPDRSEKTLANIEVRARDLWHSDDPVFSRTLVASLAEREPVLTRLTPSVSDVVAYKEAEAARTGMPWGPEQRLAAQRTAAAMDDEARLALVPHDWKLAPVVVAKPAATPENLEEDLDRELEKRLGLAPGAARCMLPSDRRRFHEQLRKDKPNAVEPTPLTERQMRDPAARIAAARREAKAK
ncbi:MAG: hypothetical protein AB7S74_16115 [Hyphomicrobium sp.]